MAKLKLNKKAIYTRCPLSWHPEVAKAVAIVSANEGITKAQAMENLIAVGYGAWKLKPSKS